MNETRSQRAPRGRQAFAAALACAALLTLPQPAAAQANTGSADFTRYVAMGDSLTAGFASGGLVQTFQRNSYPALIARQARGNTTGWEQPLVTEPGIPALNRLRSLVPLQITPDAGQGQPANLTLPRPYNNLAVPGARVRDVLVTVTGGLHDVVLRGQGTQLQQALALQPTFVSLWIGNNDVLAAATSGRVIEGVTLTPVAAFEADYRAIVAALAGAGARLALGNIPDVAAIPFVITLPPVVLNPATGQPVLVNGNPVPLIGVNAAAGDRVLLTASGFMAQGFGIPAALGGNGQPLPDAAVLTGGEIATIRARVAAYNGIIAAVANERGAALFDSNAWFNRVATSGIQVGGVTLTEDFLTGGLFSYDGVHPNAIGYAVVANLFIEAINARFGGEIPPVNLLPFLFGTATGASSTAAAPQAAGPAVGAHIHFSHEAWQNLRWALRIPSDAEIDAAKPKKPRKPRRGPRG
jgi:lysophospholipase L1-like esterase